MPVEGLILDFGEVLTRSQPRTALETMATLARLPFDELLSRYWRHRADYDRGLTGEEYWRRVLDGAGSMSAEVIADLINADFQSWSDYRPEVWDIAAAFRARGGRTAMLSNRVVEIVARLRKERALDRWFDVVVASCEVGSCKPDPEIYRICLERLGVPADATLFVDDRMENLQAAHELGLHTLHFLGDSSVPELRRALSLDSQEQ
jgi:putative hydrolase of the HAD superfamily